MTVKEKAVSPPSGGGPRREVARAAGLVSMGTLTSRVMGLCRDVAIAFAFGAGLFSDAFFVAFRVPNLIRRLLGEGPMSSAFIPVFSEYREKRNEKEAWKLASNLTGLMGGLALAITLAGMIAAPLLVRVIAPGWALESAKGDLTMRLTRLMFPYLFLVVLYALAMAVLNSCRRFFVPAAAPALLNVGMIAGALILAPFFDPPIMGLAWGVLLGGALQLGVNLPSLREVGFRWRPRFNVRDDGVRRVGRLMIPTVIGLAVHDVNQMVDMILASFLAEGSVSWLYFGSRLTQFPLGLIGIAMGTAILPTLSTQSARGNSEELKETIAFGLRAVFYLSFPAVVGLAVLRTPIMALIFQRGEFGAADTALAGQAILYYGLGMWAAGGLRVLASAFYSVKDTRTPFLTATAAMITNVVLSLYLMRVMAHAGLALASSLSITFQFFLLLQLLRRRLGPLGFRKTLGEAGKMLGASAVMGLVCHFTLPLFTPVWGWGLGGRILVVAAELLVGAGTYFVMTALLRCEEHRFFLDLLRKRMARHG
jgi:putative peptidoglycan lipid II flippase